MGLLATLLCFAVIAWLLHRDSRRRPSLSKASWIPTILVFTLASRTPAGWFDLADFVNQLYYLLVIVASLYILSSRAVKWNVLVSRNSGLMLFYGYFALTAVWSVDPPDSLVRVLKDFAINICAILVVLSDKNPMQAIRAVFVRCACAAIPLSALFTRFYSLGKNYSRDGGLSFNGIAESKNSLGEMLVVFMLFVAWDHLESRPIGAKRFWSNLKWDQLALLLAGFWLLELSQSKTSLVCLLAGLALIWTRRWVESRRIGTALFVVALSLPFLLLFTQQFGSLLTPILEALGRDATFTGRSNIWQRITWTTVNPLLGGGFWSFWTSDTGRRIAYAIDSGSEYSFIPSAHNGYLDLYLDGGFIGLGILFGLIIASAMRAIPKLKTNSFSRLRFLLLLIALVANLTESNLARPGPLWFATLLALIDYPFLEKISDHRKAASKAELPVWKNLSVTDAAGWSAHAGPRLDY